jgi:hypothetical protein
LAVLNAQCDVRYSVSHRASVARRDRVERMSILFRRADEVPVTGLQGEAVRKRGEIGNDVRDRFVNGPQVY